MHVHFHSFYYGITWWRKSKSQCFQQEIFPVSVYLSPTAVSFCKMATLNSRTWLSLHVQTSCKLWASDRNYKIKFCTLIISLPRIIDQAHIKQQIYTYLHTKYIELMYLLLTFPYCIFFFSSFTSLRFSLGFWIHCYLREIDVKSTVWCQTQVCFSSSLSLSLTQHHSNMMATTAKSQWPKENFGIFLSHQYKFFLTKLLYVFTSCLPSPTFHTSIDLERRNDI